MKKYVWLAIGTVISISLIFGVGAVVKQAPIQVSLFTAGLSTVEQTVVCTGKVEAADGREVYVDMPCVAGDVYVKEGDRVEQGDALFSVDEDATRQALSSLSSSLTESVDVPNSPVTAPVSGVVVALNVRSGAVTDYTSPCAVIAQSEGVQITVAIRERYLPQVQEGQAVTITGVAFEKEMYRGTVLEIAASAHQEYIGTSSETVVDAVVALDDGTADDSLRVGLNARVRIVVDTQQDALVIPYDCVAQTEEGEEYVYVYQNDGTAVRQIIQSGASYADGILVVSGASAGDRLVRTPETLSGTRVKVRV